MPRTPHGPRFGPLASALAILSASGCSNDAPMARPPTVQEPSSPTPGRAPASSALPSETVLPETPSADALMTRLRALMELPRTLGDPRREASIASLAGALEAAGTGPVQRIAHEAADPASGRVYALTELVGHFRPTAPRRFVLATHFDTRPWADEAPDELARDQPVPGANDGTSGLAVILELVPVLVRMLPSDVGLSVVFFDGEELGRPGHGGYCMGSRHVAQRIEAGDLPVLARAELGIVLDMVGDTDLWIPIERSSAELHPELVRHVWGVASQSGHTEFEPRPRGRAIMDDHRFLSQGGIPSILIIDREYAAWHTLDDTTEHVSGRSMQVVADVLLRSISSWYAPGGGE